MSVDIHCYNIIKMPILQDSPVTFMLSTAVLLVTTTSFLALSISLHSAYLWLAVVFITLIFLATFTCTYSLPGYFVQDASQANTNGTDVASNNLDGQTNFAVEMDTGIPYWVTVDLPPAYDLVACVLPPSYSKATGCSLSEELNCPLPPPVGCLQDPQTAK